MTGKVEFLYTSFHFRTFLNQMNISAIQKLKLVIRISTSTKVTISSNLCKVIAKKNPNYKKKKMSKTALKKFIVQWEKQTHKQTILMF